MQMLVLANEMFDSPPVFAWVLPVFVRLKPGKEETFFSASRSRRYWFHTGGTSTVVNGLPTTEEPLSQTTFCRTFLSCRTKNVLVRICSALVSMIKILHSLMMPTCCILWCLTLTIHRTARRKFPPMTREVAGDGERALVRTQGVPTGRRRTGLLFPPLRERFRGRGAGVLCFVLTRAPHAVGRGTVRCRSGAPRR